MNYEEFKTKLLEELEKNKPDEVLKFNNIAVRQTNNNQNDVISLVYKDYSNIAPVFHVNNMYHDFSSNDVSIKELVSAILEIVRDTLVHKQDFDLSNISAENAKEHLKLKPLNREWNETVEERCTVICKNDLMAVPVYEITQNGRKASFIVDRELQTRVFRMTDQEILDTSLKRVLQEGFTLKPMNVVMSELMDEGEVSMLPDDSLYVLSNKEGYFGATAAFVPDVLKITKEKLNENYFVIPSTVHELLVVRESCVGSPEELHDMLHAVNPTVDPSERLGENVYRFDGRRLQICNTMKEWERQKGNEEKVMPNIASIQMQKGAEL